MDDKTFELILQASDETHERLAKQFADRDLDRKAQGYAHAYIARTYLELVRLNLGKQ